MVSKLILAKFVRSIVSPVALLDPNLYLVPHSRYICPDVRKCVKNLIPTKDKINLQNMS